MLQATSVLHGVEQHHVYHNDLKSQTTGMERKKRKRETQMTATATGTITKKHELDRSYATVCSLLSITYSRLN